MDQHESNAASRSASALSRGTREIVTAVFMPELTAAVQRVLSKIFRALYGADPVDGDIDEYLTDHSTFVEDLATYANDMQQGRVAEADLLDEDDFAAITKFLEIQSNLLAAISESSRRRRASEAGAAR